MSTFGTRSKEREDRSEGCVQCSGLISVCAARRAASRKTRNLNPTAKQIAEKKRLAQRQIKQAAKLSADQAAQKAADQAAKRSADQPAQKAADQGTKRPAKAPFQRTVKRLAKQQPAKATELPAGGCIGSHSLASLEDLAQEFAQFPEPVVADSEFILDEVDHADEAAGTCAPTLIICQF
jgi:hypothetical protein